MMLSPERGIVVQIVLNALSCGIGLLLMRLYFPENFAHYCAYGMTIACCMFVAIRYLLSRPRHPWLDDMMAAPAIYVGAGLVSAVPSLLAVLSTLQTRQSHPLTYLSFVVLGGEIADYRNMRFPRKR